jgi:hypothetical protein
MAQKPKARGAKRKAPAKKMTPAEQSERFIKAARELGVDESGKEFERLFKKVVRASAKRTSDPRIRDD